MLKLTKTNRYQKDIVEYKKKIEKIPNNSAKQQAIRLLKELQSYCNIIDEGHSFKNSKRIDPRMLRPSIEKIVEIRISIDRLIKDSLI